MLFVGPEGIGKRAFALTLARALLCEQPTGTALDPCDRCAGCLQVDANTHPDLLLVRKPDDRQELPIKVIRELCRDLGLKPARGAWKVAIVDDADDLNDEAANAFLKTLEEPPAGSLLILIGTSVELQLPTIVSRCQVVRFDTLPETELVSLLREEGVTSNAAEAEKLARVAEGSLSRARGLADHHLAGFRRALIDDLADPRGFDPSALAARVLAFVKEAGKESVDQRERAIVLAGELARFFRDLLWQTAGLAPPCPDLDDRRAVEDLAARLDPEAVLVLADRCLEAARHVRRNAYMPLVLASLLHDLGEMINHRA
jgi:DNA polymerase-3 subunit delta'